MFFDETNNYFDEYDIDKNDFNININSINFNRNDSLHDYDDGFNKGNLFDKLYSKYKNHVYKLKVNTIKDELLYKVQMYSFILKDLILYLDTHPFDEKIKKELFTIKKKLHDVKTQYEQKYGPLCSSSLEDKSFKWINNPWPWDKGE